MPEGKGGSEKFFILDGRNSPGGFAARLQRRRKPVAISMESAAFEWNTRSTSSAAEALSLVAKAAKARVGIDFISSAMLHSRAMTGSAA